MIHALNWSPAVITTAIFAVIMWLAREWIASRLGKSIKHEYDVKLEEVKESITQREGELNSLKAGALANMSQRQIFVFEKQVTAMEKLWQAKTNLDRAIMASMTSSLIRWEDMDETKPPSLELQKLCATFCKNLNMDDLTTKSIASVRLFVSPMVWAYFIAYQSVIIDAVMRVKIIEQGLPLKYMKKDGVKKLLKKTLPEYSEYLNKYGVGGFYELLEPISDRLLDEITKMLSGQEDDKAAIQKASEIIKLAKTISHSKNMP